MRERRNEGMRFDPSMIRHVHMTKPAIEREVLNLQYDVVQNREVQIGWLMRAVTCIDLTTLSGDDCESNVQRLCIRACNPIKKSILTDLGFAPEEIKVGAVCVYPIFVPYCVRTFMQLGENSIPVASVAAGFPCGLTPPLSKLAEIKYAVEAGAKEIDIVINRGHVLTNRFEDLYREIQLLKQACGKDALMKVILSVGELGSLDNVYKASMVSMMAGADFIKTSTGKETVNANFPSGIVMARAIRNYEGITGYKVGFKPAGGIKKPKDALMWQALMNRELGKDWLFPDLFRIGASGLLDEIEKEFESYIKSQ